MVKHDIHRRQEEIDGQHDSRARLGAIRTSRAGVYGMDTEGWHQDEKFVWWFDA
jgi:hypothetical protein